LLRHSDVFPQSQSDDDDSLNLPKRGRAALSGNGKSAAYNANQSGVSTAGDSSLYCICHRPYDEREFMIGCDECGNWFHGKCVNLTQTDAALMDKYYCGDCSKKRNRQLKAAAERAAGGVSAVASSVPASPATTPLGGNAHATPGASSFQVTRTPATAVKEEPGSASVCPFTTSVMPLSHIPYLVLSSL
jgi:hypothetical protein